MCRKISSEIQWDKVIKNCPIFIWPSLALRVGTHCENADHRLWAANDVKGSDSRAMNTRGAYWMRFIHYESRVSTFWAVKQKPIFSSQFLLRMRNRSLRVIEKITSCHSVILIMLHTWSIFIVQYGTHSTIRNWNIMELWCRENSVNCFTCCKMSLDPARESRSLFLMSVFHLEHFVPG